MKSFIKNETSPDKWPLLESKLNELWNFSKELIGTEETTDMIDDGTIFLLRLFLDQKIVLLKHTSEMKKIFGPFSNQLATKICNVSFIFELNILFRSSIKSIFLRLCGILVMTSMKRYGKNLLKMR